MSINFLYSIVPQDFPPLLSLTYIKLIRRKSITLLAVHVLEILMVDTRQLFRKHLFSLSVKMDPSDKTNIEKGSMLKGTPESNSMEADNGQNNMEDTKIQNLKSDNAEARGSSCYWKSLILCSHCGRGGLLEDRQELIKIEK